ncbi:hypothetical protein Lsan_3896 [Legionella santicrucis]|uniref:Conjugative transfer region protein n=1 Tax=Legionella santicrucis TaxID=45074 RepID=A0A0W0YA61_9GAMM|nr:TIGR03750 family conjugal transfer protein [Legionella santicrucis]KTD53486.1 hypothetical protein Lsan_3896 [Legionella santicrucis]
MQQPSSRYLSHDYEAYKGLSLRELFYIAVITTPIISISFALLGFIVGYPLALACIGFVVGFIVSITICPRQAARIKAGKPHGYLMKKWILLLSHYGLKRSPYLHHRGLWQMAAIIGEKHV